jgi:hypothetical protein
LIFLSIYSEEKVSSPQKRDDLKPEITKINLSSSNVFSRIETQEQGETNATIWLCIWKT